MRGLTHSLPYPERDNICKQLGSHSDPSCLTLGQWFYQRLRECVKSKAEVGKILHMGKTFLAVKGLRVKQKYGDYKVSNSHSHHRHQK